jgi:type I restriction-modification system DNA methylase subunit
VINFVAQLVGQMLDQGAAQSHVQHLGTPADIQGRQTRLDHHLGQFDFANIVRLYRGEEVETDAGSAAMLKEKFPDGRYVDVAGLCKVTTGAEIEAQGWSLNPGRYVGVIERAADEFDFYERLEELNEELEVLNAEARELEDKIAANVSGLFESTLQTAASK